MGSDLHHVFIGLEPSPLTWVEALGALRRIGARAAVAVTAPGDPTGLAGPPRFNAAAMESGEALLLVGADLGFVPVRVGGAVEWRGQVAASSVPLDVREARQHLRAVLRDVTEELISLDIASWNSDIPELLMNRTDTVPAPSGLSSQDVEALDSAALCLAIVAAARDGEPGAISAWERSQFEASIRLLDAAARRVVVAVCSAGSDSLTSP